MQFQPAIPTCGTEVPSSREWIHEIKYDGFRLIVHKDGVHLLTAMTGRSAIRGQHDDEVQLYAFDVLAMDGEDLRRLPLTMRKPHLARLLARRPDGIFAAPFEQGEIGPDLFGAACRMGLEGLVSKHRDRAYRGGRCAHWIEIKNRKHPAMSRVMDAFELREHCR